MKTTDPATAGEENTGPPVGVFQSVLLTRAARGCPVDQLEDPRPAVLLHRMALIKTAPGTSPPKPTIVLTQAGMDLLSGSTAGA